MVEREHYNLDLLLDFLECLQSQLSVFFFVVLVGSLMGKQWYLRPWLEHYYKKAYAERSKVRKRRLRDTLNDPVLLVQIEENLLKRPDIDGDRQKMLQALEEIRDHANRDTSAEGLEDKATTKGYEKIEAANMILRATILIAIVGFCCSTYYPFFATSVRNVGEVHSYARQEPVLERYGRWSNHMYTANVVKKPMKKDPGEFWDDDAFDVKGEEQQHGEALPARRLFIVDSYGYGEDIDQCGGFGGIISWSIFCLVHSLHSFKMLRDVSRKKRCCPAAAKEKYNASSTTNKDGNNKEDLEQPLLH